MDVKKKTISMKSHSRGLAVFSVYGFLLLLSLPLLGTIYLDSSNSTNAPSQISFDRALDCQGCGQHKAPSASTVNMSITASFDGTLNDVVLVDYFPINWQIIDSNGGTIESYNSSHNKIYWHYDSLAGPVSQWYIVQAAQVTQPTTQYDFISELDGVQSQPWSVSVADPTSDTYNTSQFFTALIYNGATQDHGTAVFNLTNPTNRELTINTANVNYFIYNNNTPTTLMTVEWYNDTIIDITTNATRGFQPLPAQLSAPKGVTYTFRIYAEWVPNLGYVTREWVPFITYGGTQLNMSEWATWIFSQIFKDDFESGTTNGNWVITQPGTGTGWTANATAPLNGTYSAKWDTKQGSGTTYMNHTQDLTGWYNISVCFQADTNALDAGENLTFYYKNASGWQKNWSVNDITQTSYCIPIADQSIWNKPGFNVSFSCTQDAGVNERCWVDDVAIIGFRYGNNLRITNFTLTPVNASSQSVIQNITLFTASASINCLGGDCGDVNATLYYNGTTAGPTTLVSTVAGTTPFYASVGLNPNNTACANMVNNSNCTVSWTVNATGQPASYWLNITFNSSNTALTNNTGNFQINITAQVLGVLNVTYQSHTGTTAYNQYDTFNVTVNMTCLGGNIGCGTVNQTLMFNDTGAYPNNNVSIVSGATPMFMTGTASSRPNSYLLSGITSNPTFAYDNNYNDTTTFAYIQEPPSGISQINYTYTGISDSSTVLFYTWNGTGSMSFIGLFNYTSNSYGPNLFSSQISPITSSIAISKNNGYISSSGNVMLQINASASAPNRYLDLWDTYIYSSGNSNPYSCGSMSSGSNCSSTWTVNVTGAQGSHYLLNSTFQSTLSTQNSSANFEIDVNGGAADTTPPNINGWKWNVTNATNYSSTQGYQFNATVTDTTGISYVWVEQNFTGTLVNTTVTSCGTDVYCYNVSSLGANVSYYMKWYANDSSSNHNLNNTDYIHYYQVNKSSPILSVTLNGTAADRSYFNNTVVNIGNATTPGYINSSLNFYLDGVSITSPQAFNVNQYSAKAYTVMMNFSGDQNYTIGNVSVVMTLNDSRIIFNNFSSNVTSLSNYSSTQGYEFNSTAFNSTQVSKVWVRANFSGSFSNYTATSSGGNSWYYDNATLAAGTYIYTWWANDTYLVYYNSSNQTFQVNKSYLPITLYINGTTTNPYTVRNSTSINSTANFSSSYNYLINMWDNFSGTWQIQDSPSPWTVIYVLNPYKARDGYIIKANYSGNDNFTANPGVNVTINLNETNIPNIDNFKFNVTNSTNYSSKQGYQFNVTITEPNLDKVWIEHNFSGTLVNYTTTGNNGAEYYYNNASLGVGFYYIKWYANDTYGNLNDSDWIHYYQINKSYKALTLYINTTNGDKTLYNDSFANYTANFSTGDSTILTIYDNLSGSWGSRSSNSPLTWTRDLGQYKARDGYIVLANWSGNQNYSITSVNHTLNLQLRTPPSISNFLFNVTNATNYSSTQGYQFNATITDDTSLDKVWIEHNFTGTLTNYTVSTNVGSSYYYNYAPLAASVYYVKWYANDTDNDLNNSDFVHYYQVNKSYLPITLYINGTDSDRSLYNNSDANFTANFSSDYTYAISIWDNLSSGSWQSSTGNSPYTLIKSLTFFPAMDGYQIIANFSNANYTYSQSNHTLNLTLYDSDAPSISNFLFNVSNMTNYSSTQGYQFNATISDIGVGISYVWIEQNFTGSLANITVGSCGGAVYCYNTTPLGAGSYQYKWYANDTLGNVNTTDWVHYYQVNQTVGSVSLKLNGTEGDITLLYGGQVNASGASGYGALTLLRNGSDVSGENDTYVSLNVGYYNYTAQSAGDSNHTSMQISRFVTVNQANQILVLTLDPGASITYGTSLTVTGSGNLSEAKLYRNGTLVTSPYTATLGVGAYNFTWNTSSDGYAGNSTSVLVTVTQAPSRASLIVTPASSITYGTASNFSCSLNISFAPILYLNTTDITSQNNTLMVRAAGVYLVNCTWAGNDNYTGSENSTAYTIDKATSSIALLINGTNGDKTVYNNSLANFTAILDADAFSVTLYTNLSGTMALWDTQNSPLTNYTNLTQYPAGNYSIVANWTGNANYSASSANHTLTLNETLIPINVTTISLNYPDTGIFNVSSNISFAWTPTFYGGSPTNCSLYTNNSGTWGFSSANQSIVLNNTLNSLWFNVTGLNITWGIGCYGGDLMNYSSNRTLNVYNVTLGNSTTLVLNYPDDATTNATTKNITFAFTPTFYGGSMVNATLWTNETGAWVRTAYNSSILLNGSVNIIQHNFSLNGTYLWGVSIADQISENFSANRTLILAEPVPFSYLLTGCMNITTPGMYNLTASISNSNQARCINISVNNVTLDCHGNTIDGDNVNAKTGIWAIRAASEIGNITIKNCVITDYTDESIYFEFVNNTLVTNITSRELYYDGIYLQDCNNAIIENSSFNDGIEGNYGIDVENGRNITIQNVVAKNNNVGGIYFRKVNNSVVDNVTILNSNQYGIISDVHFINNRISNSWIQNTTWSIYLSGDSGNVIFNNFFNNTDNFGWDGINIWNTTNQSGSRIYKASTNYTQIGGNYYTNSSGNGYSDACVPDVNGFCSPLNISTMTACIPGVDCGDNVDYLPLGKPSEFLVSACVNLSAPGGYFLSTNVTGYTKCINVTSSNVTLDCRGFSIDGGDSHWNAFNVWGGPTASYDNVSVKNCVFSNWVSEVIEVSSETVHFTAFNNTIETGNDYAIYYYGRGNSTISFNNITGGSIMVDEVDDIEIVKNVSVLNNTINDFEGTRGIDDESDGLDVVIANNTIFYSGASSVVGILSSSSRDTIISNNHVDLTTTSTAYGIWLENHWNQASGNVSYNNVTLHALANPNTIGIYDEASNSFFFNNVVKNAYVGVYLAGENTSFLSNLISNSNNTGVYMDNYNSVIANNTIENSSSYGIYDNQNVNITINGNQITNATSGIVMYKSADSFIYNNMINGTDATNSNTEGIDLESATNVTSKNNSLSNWYFGVYVAGTSSSGSSFDGLNVSNGYVGIEDYQGKTRFNNVVIINMSSSGIETGAIGSVYTNLTISHIAEGHSSAYGIDIMGSNETFDTASISYVYGVGIVTDDAYTAIKNFRIFNTSGTGVNFHSYGHTIDNITVSNVSDGNGVEVRTSDRQVLSNIYVDNVFGGNYGISFPNNNQDNSVLTNCIVSSVYPFASYDGYGVEIGGTNISVVNCSVNNTTIAFGFDDENITVDASVASNSTKGVQFESRNNTLINSRISDCYYGAYLDYLGNTVDTPVRVYNNLFNNTVNFYSEGVSFGVWNTTKQSGTRIYSSGSLIGGNYYTNSSGDGYSDTCSGDADGFCSPLALNENNTDYLPLGAPFVQPYAAFSITIPGGNFSNSSLTAPGNANPAMNFSYNKTYGGSQFYVNCSYNYSGATFWQDAANPALTFNNLGTQTLTWSITLNSSIPDWVVLFANDTNAIPNNGHSLGTTPIQFSIPVGNSKGLWVYANFTNVVAYGGTVNRTALNHTST